MGLLKQIYIQEKYVKTNSILDLETCIDTAGAFHGDLCAGIIIGTRMAMLGLNEIGINDPKGADRKNLIVYVETDRCVSDAILAVTGCHPGKRTMKLLDYGKMAATFINLKTGKAVRINVKDKDKKQTCQVTVQSPDLDSYVVISEENLFNIKEVSVNLKPEDMPGKPLRKVTCEVCGERVMDMREELKDGKFLCRPCATGKNYYFDAGASVDMSTILHKQPAVKESMPKKKNAFDPRHMTHELYVSGLVNNPLILDVKDLQKMELSEVRNIAITCRSGKEKGFVESYRGVLLRTILDSADIIIKEHHAPNRIYIALSSSEGYWAIFSWHEIYNSPIGEQAVVVFEKNGNLLDEQEGDFAFVSAKDYRKGPRRLKYLQRIEVNELVADV